MSQSVLLFDFFLTMYVDIWINYIYFDDLFITSLLAEVEERELLVNLLTAIDGLNTQNNSGHSKCWVSHSYVEPATGIYFHSLQW